MHALQAGPDGELVLAGSFRERLDGPGGQVRGRRFDGFQRADQLCPSGQSHGGFVVAAGGLIVALERRAVPELDGFSRGSRLFSTQELSYRDGTGKLTWPRQVQGGRLLDFDVDDDRYLYVLSIDLMTNALQVIAYEPMP